MRATQINLSIIVPYHPLVSRKRQPHRSHRHRKKKHPHAATLSSHLQPGGEREWKVDRENISALSAIFFHKWLRATAENHGWNAVHSQTRGGGEWHPRTEASLSRQPHRCPPWPQAFQSDEPAQHHPLRSPTSTRAEQSRTGGFGGGGEGGVGGSGVSRQWMIADDCKTPYGPAFPSKHVHTERKSAQMSGRGPAFFSSPNVCCWCCPCGTQRMQADSAGTARDRGGGVGGGGGWVRGSEAESV